VLLVKICLNRFTHQLAFDKVVLLAPYCLPFSLVDYNHDWKCATNPLVYILDLLLDLNVLTRMMSNCLQGIQNIWNHITILPRNICDI